MFFGDYRHVQEFMIFFNRDFFDICVYAIILQNTLCHILDNIGKPRNSRICAAVTEDACGPKSGFYAEFTKIDYIRNGVYDVI